MLRALFIIIFFLVIQTRSFVQQRRSHHDPHRDFTITSSAFRRASISPRSNRASRSIFALRRTRRGAVNENHSWFSSPGSSSGTDALNDLLLKAGINPLGNDVTIERLSSEGAFCNDVYLVNVKNNNDCCKVDFGSNNINLIPAVKFIAKIFSHVALARMVRPSVPSPPAIRHHHSNYYQQDAMSTAVGKMDQLAASAGIAPRLVASTDFGILVEFCHGRTLTEHDIHQRENHDICTLVAQALARLHCIQQPPLSPTEAITTTPIEVDRHRRGDSATTPPVSVLWHACEKMLDMSDPHFNYQGWSIDRLRQELHRQKSHLDGFSHDNHLELPLVHVGHGDFKPANVILQTAIFQDGLSLPPPQQEQQQQVKLIDFELAGTHYRAFDLAKFFRTDCSTHITKRNQLVFYNAYAEAVIGQGGQKEVQQALVEAIQQEVDLVYPLTWLEAAIFFVCMAGNDPSHAHDRWNLLAGERLQGYLRSSSDKVAKS